MPTDYRYDPADRVRAGNPARITLDGIAERTFRGWVESTSGGTGVGPGVNR